MSRPGLDIVILEKIAKKRRGSINSVRVLVSKKARKLNISTPAALVLVAAAHGVPTTVYQRKLLPEIREEIRSTSKHNLSPTSSTVKSVRAGKDHKRGERRLSDKAVVRRAIAILIRDAQLRSRCADILLATGNFDRPINQATQILEDRIRRKANPSSPMVGENLANYAFKENVAETVLRVASNDGDLQRGLSRIIRGIVPAFRNATHHHIVDTYTREDALSICFFVDLLLRAVDDSVLIA